MNFSRAVCAMTAKFCRKDMANYILQKFVVAINICSKKSGFAKDIGFMFTNMDVIYINYYK